MNQNEKLIAIIGALVVVVSYLAFTLFWNLFLVPFILYSIGGLFFQAPLIAYQIAWIVCKILTLFAK